MLHTLRFSLQNSVYFIMLPFFGTCIIHILHTGCAKNLNVKFRCQKVNTLMYMCWGHAVAQSVEALRYNPEGRGFDSRWCH